MHATQLISRLIFGWIVLIAGSVAGSNQLRSQTTSGAQEDARTLRVGAASDSFPRSYLAANGRCEGFNVDILDAVARVMDIRFERVIAPSAELEERFSHGELDMLQAFTPGPGRHVYAEFSAPTLILNGAVFIRKNSGIRSIRDLNGAALIVVGRGTVADQLIRDFGIQPRTVEYRSSVEEALQLINQGRFDATFASRLSGLSIVSRDGLSQVSTLSAPLIGYEVKPCFAARRGDIGLIARLNEGLAVLHQTGEYDQIYQKWFARLEKPLITREAVIGYVGPVLTAALLLTVYMLLRQRKLGQHLARQAAQLAQSEALLAEAQHIAHVGHWRYDLTNGSLFCSEETERILERRPGDPALTYRRLLSRVPRGERAVAHRAARDTLNRGTSSEVTVSMQTSPNTRKVVQVKAQALRSRDGAVTGIFGTLQDITQQKIFEEDLRSREQLLRAIYHHVPSGLGVVQPEGDSFRFVSANPGMAAVLGLDPQTALAGKFLAKLNLPKATVDFWTEWFNRGLEQAELLKAEANLASAKRQLSLTLIPLGLGQQGAPQLCFLVEDITVRKQLDAEIAQGRRLRAVGELVGGIAHEFNNLLTPVLLKSEILLAEWRDEPRLIEELNTISRAAQRGADLTRRLLAFGRRSEAAPEETRLHAIVKANVDLLTPTIDRRISIRNQVSEALPALYLNSSDLHQVVVNLLLNARDTLVEKLGKQPAGTFQAEITIEAGHYGANAITPDSAAKRGSPLGWICLTIRDNGMGMPHEVQERIFEPFYTTKGVGKGTGLGLATVWHVVTRMGGKVNVQSQPGDGTSFQVWLPVFSPPNQTEATKVAVVNDTAPGTAKICLVEDDDLVAQTITNMLRRQQHSVVLFRNGTEAWQHLSGAKVHYQVILLDLDLPGISGLEIVRRLRAHKIPGRILVASGRLTPTEVSELEKLGVDFQIEKPFTPQKLHLAVQSCLQKLEQV